MLFLLTALPLLAKTMELTRIARPWEFLDAPGKQAAWLGHEDGSLEAYVYPLKLVDHFHLTFTVDGRKIPSETAVRRVIARPGSTSLVYSGDEFQVTQTLITPVDEPGGLMFLEVRSHAPLRIDCEFTRDFQLMWPASFATGYGEWSAAEKAFIFGGDGQPYAAVFGSADASLVGREYATDYAVDTHSSFSLGSIQGTGTRVVAFAGSTKSRADALTSYRTLIHDAPRLRASTERFYEDYLSRTLDIDIPDRALQDAYDWSKLSVVKGMVRNPLLGEGLVAGYGPSKGTYRPGYSWFFGRDTFWTVMAMHSAGDFANAREAIAFISKFQRADGKIPHEIAQSASLVPWFDKLPWAFSSADATLLYPVAVRDYVEASGDVAFAGEQWERMNKALAFSRSTMEEAGFPRNLGVGHGWIEGGPLLPVRVELYQAACYVEALRSMSRLASLLGKSAESAAFDREFQLKQKRMNEVFWAPREQTYAFALDSAGKPLPQTSVLAIVPMWWSLLDPEKARILTSKLAAEPHASDWGMRIISSEAPQYDPSGYHFGSVWPLFTGWAALGEYNSHMPAAGYANLKANAWLALDGAGGNTTEVLSGATYSELSTSSPHQIWSAAMVVSPLVRGLLGLSVDVPGKRIVFAPQLPADWDHVAVHRISFGSGTVDLTLHRDRDSLTLQVDPRGVIPFKLIFAPAYSGATKVQQAKWKGTTVNWESRSDETGNYPRFTLPVEESSNLQIRHSPFFGYSVEAEAPRMAEASGNLKVISEKWETDGSGVQLQVTGKPNVDYYLKTTGGDRLTSVAGAKLLSDGRVQVQMHNGIATIHMKLRTPPAQ